MEYLKVLKEQSGYIDEEIGKLIKELARLSNNNNNNEADAMVTLQRYYEEVENLHEEMKTLKATTHMNIKHERKLQKTRKAVISEVSKYVKGLENILGISASPNRSISNGMVQNETLEISTDKNASTDLGESFDNEDVSVLLNMPVPTLLPR